LHDDERNGKVIWKTYPGPDHHQMFITSIGSPLVHACHVWSTSVTTIVSYPVHRTTERTITLLRQPWQSNNCLHVGGSTVQCRNSTRTDCRTNICRSHILVSRQPKYSRNYISKSGYCCVCLED